MINLPPPPPETVAELLDKAWEAVVLGVVGGTIEADSDVTGIRVVDKVTPHASTHITFSTTHSSQPLSSLVPTVRRCMAAHNIAWSFGLVATPM